jgi:hypothetical protein
MEVLQIQQKLEPGRGRWSLDGQGSEEHCRERYDGKESQTKGLAVSFRMSESEMQKQDRCRKPMGSTHLRK